MQAAQYDKPQVYLYTQAEAAILDDVRLFAALQAREACDPWTCARYLLTQKERAN